MTGIGMTIALILFSAGLGSYRRTVAQRDAWVAEHERTRALSHDRSAVFGHIICRQLRCATF